MYEYIMQLISSAMSSKILKAALIQQKEIQAEDSDASNKFVFPNNNNTVISDEDYFDEEFTEFQEIQTQFGHEVNVCLITYNRRKSR